MRGPIAWFADNHVAANLLMLFLLLAGAVTAYNIKVEVFPEASLDVISVSVTYPSATPSEVEQSVLRLVEESVSGLAGVKRIDSTAGEGSGSVSIQVMKGWDVQELLDDVKAEVDRIDNFPAEAEKPIVSEAVRRTEVIDVVVFGDVPEGSLKSLAQRVKDEITNLDDITLATMYGDREREIHIEVSEHELRRYGLTMQQVATAVSEASLDLPAGAVKTAGGEILVRTKGRRYWADEYSDVAVIARSDGSRVTLGQIARLAEGYEDEDRLVLFQGKPAMVIQVYRVADQNAFKVAGSVKKYVEDVRSSMPNGVDISYFRDRSEILQSRLDLLLRNMGIGLLCVVVMLALFLDFKLAFWVTMGIPISFMAGLWALPYCDVSINMISLFAFIMVLGIVVDDAIVVGENIYRLREAGDPPLKASVEGAVEVGQPVIFAVLTSVAAFWPLLMGEGVMGKVMRNIPIVVIMVLFGSLVESLFILPAHLNKKRRAGYHEKKGFNRLLKWVINRPYAWFVKLCVRWRYACLALGVAAILLTVGYWKSGAVKFVFFPRVESDWVVCRLTLPVGTPSTRTEMLADFITKMGQETIAEFEKERPEDAPPLMEHVITQLGVQSGRSGPHSGPGSSGGNKAEVRLVLLEGEQRDISALKIRDLWREKVGEIPDAESLNFKSELFSPGNAIEVDLSIDDHDMLLAATEELKAELRNYSGVFDIEDSFLPGKEELQLKLKPTAADLGLTLDDLARQVRHALYGAEALSLQRGQDDVKVLVRYPDNERRTLDSIRTMRIRTPDGLAAPFSQVAEVSMERGYASIGRSQRRRVVTVSADVKESETNADEIRAKLEAEYLPGLKNNFPGLQYDIEGEGKEKKESMRDVIQGFALALFLIYALLAIPFKSFIQPVLVMLAIPFGLVGAIWGHMIMGMPVSFLSVFGAIGLTGVVVNDSLVLIHMTNNLRRKGLSAFDAVTSSGKIRFRAIILTSVTTFAGLTPMILEKSLQAKFLIPMAVSLGFGVLFATGVTLLLIPCCYVILEDIKALARWFKPVFFLGGDNEPAEES